MSKLCLAPWVSTYIYPDGGVSPCCESQVNGKVYTCGSLHENTLTEIWNNERYKKIRSDMIKYGYSEVCHSCYNLENSGSRSRRNFFNDNYSHHRDKIKLTKEDGTFDKVNIVYWDVRLSSTCNFKCRMCGPLLSSSWVNELDKNTNFLEEFFGDDEIDVVKTNADLNFLDSEKFLNENIFLFDIIESVYFAGGEPLLMDIHYKILKKLIQFKKTNIPISYTTNFSVIKYKNINILNLWSLFPNLTINISVDGIGKKGELIRKGFDWDRFISNCLEFKKKFPKKTLTITPALQSLNCFDIFELQKELFRLKIVNNVDNFWFSVVQSPDYLSILILPDNLKQRFCDMVDDHVTNFLIPNKASIEQIKLWVNTKKFIWSKDDQNLIPKFLRYTESLDIIRNENTKETFPELNDLWNYDQ